MYQSEPIDPQAPVTGPTIVAVDPADASEGPTSILPGFLAELARAMQAAAERERDRIDEFVTQDAAVHVEKARTRAAAEAGELSRLAEADVARIKDWSKTEIDRIRRDAERRTNERRKSLEAFLAKHDSIIETEIGGVDVAIRRYREELDRFFGELTGSVDPNEIVRRADSLPKPPDLDAVRAAARAGAVSELADLPDLATDESGAYELAGDEAAPEIEAASPESDAGLGVMDPDAVGRSDDLPIARDGVEAEDGVKVVFADPADHSNVAVRLLRSIAPWTTQADEDAPDKGAHTA
jgi:hypothetical protein